MASAVEQLAAGLNWSAFSKAQELKKRLLFTLGALIVYRFGTHVPVPGIDPTALSAIFHDKAGGMLKLFNMFSGGSIARMAVFSLGIVPYISASIIVQLLSSVIPHLMRLKKEGTYGRRALNQYTRYLTVLLAVFQGYGVALTLEVTKGLVENPGAFFEISTTLTLLTGTVFLTWLGEQITARGVGNGTSLIIFSGIVAQFPSAIVSVLELGRQGALPVYMMFLFFVIVLAIIGLVVFVERAQRRVLIQYPKQHAISHASNRSHIPIKINVSGVIPPVFSSSLLVIPAALLRFLPASLEEHMGGAWFSSFFAHLIRGNALYLSFYAFGITFFCFFYASIVFEPNEVAENIKKGNGFIPGIRPGKATADFLERILMRLTVLGALYLVGVCLVPEMLISNFGLPVAFGGTSLLIVVSVVMDLIGQIQGHIMAQQYEGLLRKTRLKRSRR